MKRKTTSILFASSFLLVSLLLFSSSKEKQSTAPSKATTGTVTDVDGNEYKTVVIANREWMAENLRTTKFNDGTEIPNVTSRAAWSNLTDPGYCWYDNDAAYGPTYGAMYNWFAVNTGKLCPEGWRVPTRTEFNSYLRDELGGANDAGGKLKSTGTVEDGSGLWLTPNTGATNESGFTHVPSGKRHAGAGSFQYIGLIGYLWASGEYGGDEAKAARVTISSTGTGFSTGVKEKTHGYPVRCLKN